MNAALVPGQDVGAQLRERYRRQRVVGRGSQPVGRSWQDFYEESTHHGWPSFRDEETIFENVRVLPGGETVSVNKTHLGHNLPDAKGNRYCINIVCVAGRSRPAPLGVRSRA